MYSTGLASVGVQAANARQAANRWGLARAAAVAAKLALTVVLPVSLGVASFATAARAPQQDLPSVAIGALPPEARATYQLIHSGGPFPYDKDGTVFQNRERLLPAKNRGHYREYTVKTPRSRDRGARRIVCGGKPPTAPEACYYTADHYASFSRIAAP